jgi:hypothetical protein
MSYNTEELLGILSDASGYRAVTYAGLDDAIVGIANVWAVADGGGATRVSVAAYDYQKIMEILMERVGMSEDEAMEHIEFNLMSGFVGPYTPVFLNVNGECSFSDGNEDRELYEDFMARGPEIAD